MTGKFGTPPLSGYAVAELASGSGVILNLETGKYFKVNRSGCLIFNVLLKEGTSPAGVRRIGHELRVPDAEALRLCQAMLDGLNQQVPRHPPTDTFVYSRLSDGTYTMSDQGRTIFSVDEKQHAFWLHEPIERLRGPLDGYVRALLPKLISLLGMRVIHAACVLRTSGTLAFTGLSGAGKTTTARAFQAAGAALVSEDLLVLRASGRGVEVCLRAEELAREWSHRWAAALSGDAARRTDYTPLREVEQTSATRLSRLWFIAADRRRGSSIELTPLDPMGGMLGLLANGFLGSERPEVWRRFLETGRMIAETVALTEARMPDGLPELQQAARDYMTNSAS